MKRSGKEHPSVPEVMIPLRGKAFRGEVGNHTVQWRGECSRLRILLSRCRCYFRRAL